MSATFDDFWSVYPRRTAKAAAAKSWSRAVEKMKLDPAAIVAGAQRYAEEKKGADQQYIAHPATWINQQRWLDEPAAPAPEEKPAAGPNYSNAVTITRVRMEVQKKLIERTRHANWGKIRDAAGRLRADPVELWSAMLPDMERVAYRLALEEATGGTPAPETIEITRELWLHGKDRYETRARCIRDLPNQRFSELRSAPTINARRETHDEAVRVVPSDADTQDAGVAREAPPGAGGIGCEYPDERGPGEDPEPLGDQAWEAAAGQP